MPKKVDTKKAETKRDVAIFTKRSDYGYYFDSNDNSASFSAVTATNTEPTGDGKVKPIYNHILVVPFGTGSDNNKFDIRLIGWRAIDSTYVPVNLGRATCTLSSSVTGAASGDTPNNASDLFADNIAISDLDSPLQLLPGEADQLPAALLVDCMGCDIVELQVNVDSATNGNALYALL